MANLDAPHGFTPVQSPHGNDIPTQEFQCTTGSAVYPGQLMFLADTGLISIWTGTATGVNHIVGAALDYVPSAAAAGNRACGVSIDLNQQYSVQCDDNSITAMTDGLGAGFQIINASTGSSTLLVSLAELDASSATTTNNTTTVSAVQMIRFAAGSENVLAQSYNDVIVRIRHENHLFGGGTDLPMVD